MRGGSPDRAASTQLGAVLLFGFMVVGVSVWQAQVIPAENAKIEFAHSQRVQDDMQAVRNAVVSAPDRGTGPAVAVEMAPTYPPRTVFVNPRPPQGTLRTVGTDDAAVAVAVANATAGDDAVGDYWDGTTRTFETGALAYEPGYNEYDDAPTTVYENSVLYNRFGEGVVVVAGQDVIDGRSIRLVALDGELSTTRSGGYTVDVSYVSASSRTVALTDAAGAGNVTVTFPSRLDAARWEELLADELVPSGGHVVDVRSGPIAGTPFHAVTVELEGGVTYELGLAKVGVGSRVTHPGPRYVVDVEGDGASIPTGGSQRLVVEVRDRFNNPVSGVTVRNDSTSDPGGGSLDAERKTTGADGRATFTFTAGSDDATIAFTISDDADVAATESVTFDVEVTGGGGGAYAVFWADPSGQNGVSCPGGPDDVCTLDADAASAVTLTMATDPIADGASVTYAVNDTTVGTVSPTAGTTDGSGEHATTFTPLEDGTVKVYTTSGSGGDTLTLRVVDSVDDLVYNGDAVARDGPDGDSVPGGVDLSFTNTFGQNLTVTEVRIDGTGDDVASLDDGGVGGFTDNDQPRRTELYVAATRNDGWVDALFGVDLPATFDVDADGFSNDGNPVVSAGGTTTVYLYEFENDAGRVDMNGRSFTITIVYELEDGTAGQKTVTVTA